MTVTAIDSVQHRLGRESDADRLRLTAGDLVFQARRIVGYYGHFGGDGFGSQPYGFSLEGAVYVAARFYDGDRLRDPARCSAHTRRRYDLPRPCEPGCEDPLWRQCSLAISYLAEALRTPRERQVCLHTVRASVRDWIEVVEANARLDRHSALEVLHRVCVALTPRHLPPARALAGAA